MERDTSQSVPELEVGIPKNILREILKPPIELTKDEHAVFHWSEDSLNLGTIDGSNVMKVRQEVDASDFEYYNLNSSDGTFDVGLPCGRIAKLLDATETGDEDTVHIEYNQAKDKVDLEIENVQQSFAKVDKSSIREPDDGDLTHSIEALVHKRVFDQAYRIIGTIASRANFKLGDGQGTIYGSSDTDDSKISLTCTAGDKHVDDKYDVVFLEDDEEEASAEYDLTFINNIRKFVPNRRFQLEFDDSYPLRIEAIRQDDTIKTEIILAPIVVPEE